MFGLGPLEIIILFMVLVVLFGGKLFPRLGKSLGETIQEIRHFSKSKNNDAVSSEESEPDKSEKRDE